MREDLIGAKGYEIGYKAVDCGDSSFTMMVVSSYEEAIIKLNEWAARGWQTKILPVQ